MSISLNTLWEDLCNRQDEESFVAFYEATKRLVYTIGLRVLRNEEDAADATQAAYCRLLIAARKAESTDCDDAQVFVARHAFREAENLKKRRDRRGRRELAVDPLPPLVFAGPSPGEVAVAHELRARVETLIHTLPEQYRMVLFLRFFHGLSQKEIAGVLQIPVATAASRIARGVKRLRPLFRRAGLGEVSLVLAALIGEACWFDPPAALAASVVFARGLEMGGSDAVGGGAAASAGTPPTGGLTWTTVAAGVILALSVGIWIVPRFWGQGSSSPTTASPVRPQDPPSAAPFPTPGPPLSSSADSADPSVGGTVDGLIGVTDWSGRAAVAAAVTVDYSTATLTLQTDAQGSLRFEVPAETAWRVEARNANGIARADAAGSRAGSVVWVPLALRNEAILRGRIVDPEGEGLSDVRMVALVDGIDPSSASAASGDTKATRLRTLGEFIGDGGTIAGRIRRVGQAAECDCPEFYRTIAVGLDNGENGELYVAGEGVTDGAGRYEMKPLLAGSLAIMAISDRESSILAPLPRRVSVAPDHDVGGLDFTVAPATYLEGRIQDPDGKPIKGAWITGNLLEPGNNEASRAARTSSSIDGTFILGSVPFERFIEELIVEHPDYAEARLDQVDPFGGPVVVTLTPHERILLVAVDGDTGLPVKKYRYRILKKTHMGYTSDLSGRNGHVVSDPKGEVLLRGIEGEDLIAQIVALDAGGTPTGPRGARAFSLLDSATSGRVEVTVLEPKYIRGTVRRIDGTNVSGAVLATERMNDSTTFAPISRVPDFDAGPVESSEDGQFALGPLMPGRYTLDVSKDGQRPANRPVVTVPNEGEPEAIEVRLDATGVILGRVTYRGGGPVSGGKLWAAANYPGSVVYDRFSMSTDETGWYRLDGLPNGSYQVGVDGERGHQSTAVENGEEERIDFELVASVQLTGSIRVSGGEALDSSIPGRFHFMPKDGGERVDLYPRSGQYVTSVKPGAYYFTAGELPKEWWVRTTPDLAGGLVKEFVVEEKPEEQRRDFEVVLSSVLAVVDAPDDEPFRPGSIELSQRYSGSIRERMAYLHLSRPTGVFEPLCPGEYKARFRSDDGTWMAESRWETVHGGKNNTIVLFPQEDRTIHRLGGWSAQALHTTSLPHTQTVRIRFDASWAILENGTYTVFFDYESGPKGIRIEEVLLLLNDAPIGRDTHSGWAGLQEFGIYYTFSVSEVANSASVSVEAAIVAEPEAESTGSIYLYRNE